MNGIYRLVPTKQTRFAHIFKELNLDEIKKGEEPEEQFFAPIIISDDQIPDVMDLVLLPYNELRYVKRKDSFELKVHDLPGHYQISECKKVIVKPNQISFEDLQRLEDGMSVTLAVDRYVDCEENSFRTNLLITEDMADMSFCPKCIVTEKFRLDKNSKVIIEWK